MNGMEIVTREQAKLAGSSKFFLGETCKRGHIDQKYVANGKCVVCQRLEMKERYWQDPALRIQKVKEWTDANPDKKRAYSRKYKQLKPTGYFTNKRREQEAGRSRPEVCELCVKPNSIDKPIYWDHCHKTGKFRGWICHSCNSILGRVQDSADLLRKMADYVERGGIE